MKIKPTIKEKLLSSLKGREQQTFLPHEVVDLVLQKYPGTNRSSVLPADYCYNRINKGIKFNFHIFESLPDGSYKFVGPDYPFNGPVLWKGKQVGTMKKGHYVPTRPLV